MASKIKLMIDEAKDASRKAKELVLRLLNEPMSEEQKEIVFELYKLLK